MAIARARLIVIDFQSAVVYYYATIASISK
jgi:hypothetical protein